MFHVKRLYHFCRVFHVKQLGKLRKTASYGAVLTEFTVLLLILTAVLAVFILFSSILVEEILRFVLFKNLKTFYNAVEIVARVVIDVDSSFIVVAERVYFCGENALQSRNHVL